MQTTDRYSIVYDKLCEKIINNELTFKEAAEIEKVASVIYENFVDDFFNHFKSPAQAKSEFKKKYRFVSINSKHPDVGFVSFKDGKTYLIDMERTSKIRMEGIAINYTMDQTDRVICADITSDKGKIFIDDSFWKLTPKERDSIIAHEMGHITMHSITTSNKNLDKRFISLRSLSYYLEIPASELKTFFRYWGPQIKSGVMSYFRTASKKPEDKILKDLRDNVLTPYVKEYYDAIKQSKQQALDDHLDIYELEADAYSSNVNKDDGKNLVSALKKHDKNIKKSIIAAERNIEFAYINKMISKKEYDEAKKELTRYKLIYDQCKKETDIRKKVTKDKTMHNNYYGG